MACNNKLLALPLQQIYKSQYRHHEHEFPLCIIQITYQGCSTGHNAVLPLTLFSMLIHLFNLASDTQIQIVIDIGSYWGGRGAEFVSFAQISNLSAMIPTKHW